MERDGADLAPERVFADELELNQYAGPAAQYQGALVDLCGQLRFGFVAPVVADEVAQGRWRYRLRLRRAGHTTYYSADDPGGPRLAKVHARHVVCRSCCFSIARVAQHRDRRLRFRETIEMRAIARRRSAVVHVFDAVEWSHIKTEPVIEIAAVVVLAGCRHLGDRRRVANHRLHEVLIPLQQV